MEGWKADRSGATWAGAAEGAWGEEGTRRQHSRPREDRLSAERDGGPGQVSGLTGWTQLPIFPAHK